MTELIKLKRKEKGYTQEDMANNLNITLRQYQLYEHFKQLPNFVTGYYLCYYLNINQLDLIESYKTVFPRVSYNNRFK